MPPVEHALLSLDEATVRRVRPVLGWLRSHHVAGASEASLLRRFLSTDLPAGWTADEREQHEVAWALGDLYAQAGRPELAALCRAAATHATLAVWHWTRSFTGVRPEFWQPALDTLGAPDTASGPVPARFVLSLGSARALLETVGDGLRVTDEGRLLPATVLALDDRFRWTEEFPWMRAVDEVDVPPLRFLHEHLLAQRLLVRNEGRVRRTEAGVACTRDTARLWRAMVAPSPRWTREFERDALGVMAASVLRSADFTLGRIGEEMTQVLAGKWRPADAGRSSSIFDGASAVALTWYQLGVPLGWWDTGRGPADRRPNAFGRAAAAAMFRAVAGPPAGLTGRGAAPRS